MIGAGANNSFGLIKDCRALELKSPGAPHNQIFQVVFLPKQLRVRAGSLGQAGKRLLLVRAM